MRNRTFAFRGWASFVVSGVLAASLLMPALVHAQSVSPTDEYRKLVTAGQSVTPLGAHPFGESVNLYNGSLSFEVTDISIPGIGPALSLSRSLDTASGRPLGNLDRDRPFGDWDLDIPRIETETAYQANVTGWWVASYGNAGYTDRCTYFGAPPPVNSTQGAPPWSPDQWWHGYNLIIPGQGSQNLLAGAPASPQPANGTWSIDTKQNWRIGCGVTADGNYGEGFVALAPDGTRYTFAHLIYRPMPGLTKPLDEGPDAVQANGVRPMVAPFDIISRREGLMYVTKIEDRFGNTLTYNWSSNDPDDPIGDHLNSIVASDGRELDFSYISGTPLIHTITEVAANGASPRVWTYSYDRSGVEPLLTGVQLPDGSAWSYQLGSFQKAVLVTQAQGYCRNGSSVVSIENGGTPTGSMNAPSGLTATFTLQSMVRGRSDVPLYCWTSSNDINGFPHIPDEYAQYSLVEEDLSGPGLPTGSPANDCQSGASFCLKYSYSPLNASWKSGQGNCSSTVYTDVTDPLGHDARYTYSNCFDASEGKLLRTDTYSGAAGSTVMRSVVNGYANPTGGPWPAAYGSTLQPYLNSAQLTEISPLKTSTMTQDGTTFTTGINAFNDFAQATSTTTSSSLGYSKTDTTSFDNDLTNWVLGLVTQTTTNGIVDSQTSYDSHDMPTVEKSFGRAVSTKTWNYAAGQSGTLASIADGIGHTTVFSTWYRGVPEKITYADGSSQSATINGNGWVTSITDENGDATNYAYDPMGRLTQISYPSGDDVAWNPTSLSFAPVTAAELGIAGGHWKQVVHTGSDYSVTYFDAYWRPLVSDHYDSANFAGTLSRTITRYDADGRTIFTSYPTRSNAAYTASLPGTQTSYDALARPTKMLRDWDLDSTAGPLPTIYQYLSEFKTEVTDPNGNSTTTSYMAYGEPTTDWPVSISAPMGQVTTIRRDVFGKPLSIARTGAAAGTRSYVYNGYQQLCGRTDPETATTAFGYDPAGNLVWSASGLGVNTTSCYSQSQASSSGRAVSRSYDPRNRLISVTYPDAYSNATFSYYPDGAPETQTETNTGIATTYRYDKRRLLTSENLSIPGASSSFTLSYGHDANGHLASTTYPDGRGITYAPNALGQPTQAGSYATGVTWYPNGEIAGFKYQDGAIHSMSETTRGFVGRSADTLGGVAGMDFTYAYDGDANVASITDNTAGHVGNVDMTYDGLDRLAQAVSPMFGSSNADTATYRYDVLDNLTSASVGAYGSFNYLYSSSGQLSELTDSSGHVIASYTYDPLGNLASKDGQAFQFDMANRLRSVADAASYLYDAAGRRVQKIEAASGNLLESQYSKAGQLMFQWQPATQNGTDYIYLGDMLVSRVVGNNSTVIGWIDGVASTDPPAVHGWACSTGLVQSINVELFVGGPSGGGGIRVATATADQPSEPAVASSCKTSGTAYRFSISLSSAMRSQYAGEAIYMYGDSPVGNSNNELSGSGNYSVPPNPGAPPAPASISVPASSSTGNITVSWSAVSTATSYMLQQQLNGGAWTNAYSGSATSTSLSGLGNGSYVYRVQACNSVGCSAPTTSTTLKVALIPAPPASITAPSSSYSPSFGVSWSASANTTNYVLEESVNGGGWGVAYNGAATSTTITVSASGTYRFQVSACGAGGCSGFAVSGNVAVTLKPTAAPSLSGPSSSSSGTFTLTWNTVSGATRYQLNQNLSGKVTSPYNAGGTSWTSSNLGNGTYGYQVFGCNAAGCGPGSNGITVKVLHIPAPPPYMTAPDSVPYPGNRWSISIAASSGASSYNLRRTNLGSTGSPTTVITGVGTSTSDYTVPGTYQYAAQACNASGCSGWRNAGNTTTVFCAEEPAATQGGVSPDVMKCNGGP